MAESKTTSELPDAVNTFEEFISVRRQIDERENPRYRYRDHVVLRDNSKSALWAEHGEFLNEQTGGVHHSSLKISTVKKSSIKMGGQYLTAAVVEDKKVWLNNDERREIEKLRDFIVAIPGLPTTPGEYLIVPLGADTATNQAVRRAVGELKSNTQAAILIQLLTSATADPATLQELISIAETNPDSAKVAAASLNLGRYSEAIAVLEDMIESNAKEHDFQSLLEAHPWMFGSEYSERLGRRDWIRDQQTDFMMRRTADSYLELIEIKRPLKNSNLFNRDDSHRSWYPSSELSQVIGQVIGYIDQLDAKRNDIHFDDGELVNKIRAKIIVGRDINQDQVDALRRLNGHLHRIEVITFDQLHRTACRVRDHLQEVLEPIAEANDIPDVPDF